MTPTETPPITGMQATMKFYQGTGTALRFLEISSRQGRKDACVQLNILKLILAQINHTVRAICVQTPTLTIKVRVSVCMCIQLYCAVL